MKWASHKETDTVWFHLCEGPRVIKFIETESKIVVTKEWEIVMGIEFELWNINSSGGWLYTVWITVNTTQLYIWNG